MAQNTLPYYQAACFKNMTTAGVVYDAVQKHIYADIDCDLSAYRFKLNTTWHVVVIGEKPSDKTHVQIEAQLTNGILTTLDEEVLSYLMDRRGQAVELGPWVEVHYQPPDE